MSASGFTNLISKLDAAPALLRLRDNRLFSAVPPELLSTIGTQVEWFQVARDAVIFCEGEAGDCLYVVHDGAVRISKAGRGGTQETLGFILAGDFFGEMALIDGLPRSARATAAEPCILGRLDAKLMAHLWEMVPRHAQLNMLRSEVERLRGMNSRFIEELLRTERLSLVGAMANSILHDLKNPLTIICSATELIDWQKPDSQVARLTQRIRHATACIEDMLQGVLDFARGQTSVQLQRQPVQEVLAAFDRELLWLIPAHVQLVRHYGEVGEVQVDTRYFIRVLLNLVKNALEAMPNEGKLTIVVTQDEGQVVFIISDTGCGIAPEFHSRIFEPFVSVGKATGTGLGLAIAQSVVEAHHGYLALSSQVGVGTTVEVRLPQCDHRL
jgi:signal transduction histidine kinase